PSFVVVGARMTAGAGGRNRWTSEFLRQPERGQHLRAGQQVEAGVGGDPGRARRAGWRAPRTSRAAARPAAASPAPRPRRRCTSRACDNSGPPAHAGDAPPARRTAPGHPPGSPPPPRPLAAPLLARANVRDGTDNPAARTTSITSLTRRPPLVTRGDVRGDADHPAARTTSSTRHPPLSPEATYAAAPDSPGDRRLGWRAWLINSNPCPPTGSGRSPWSPTPTTWSTGAPPPSRPGPRRDARSPT